MKTCKELAEGAIARGKILRRRRKKAVAAISVTVCVCLLTGVPLLLRTSKATSTLPEGEGEWYEDGSVVMEEPHAPNVTAEKSGESETHTVPAPPDEGPLTEAAALPSEARPSAAASEKTDPDPTSPVYRPSLSPGESPTGDGSFGNSGEFVIPTSGDLIRTGEPLTDEEAAAVLPARLHSLQSVLGTGPLTATEQGHCHIRLPENLGEPATMAVNFRDYYVYEGDTLVAILTLVKENGVIYDTPSFGAPWFRNLQYYLSVHTGVALKFFYAGNGELLLAPDGDPKGIPADMAPENAEALYMLFDAPEAVYVP